MPTYTDLQRAQLRLVMGYSKLFSSSNSIFENALNTYQGNIDDGSTFNETISILGQIQGIDTLISNNQNLGLATAAPGVAIFDAYRNDRMLRSIGRNYIKRLSIILSLRPAQDYYGRATTSVSGNVYPINYTEDTSDQIGD